MGVMKFVQALSILLGTIIGVGLFSLPFIASKVGLWTMLFYFIILGAVVIWISLLYGEVVLRTAGLHRLPGYAEKYLGPWGKKAALFSSILGLTGALLAYLVVGGKFFYSLVGPFLGGSYFLYAIVFFAAGALLTFFGAKSIARIEFLLLLLFFAVLALVFWGGHSYINPDHLFNFDSSYLFLPYGVVLFSLAGFVLVPEIKEILYHRSQWLKGVIISAISLAVFTYLFFIVLVLGITGQKTSPEAIIGLQEFLDPFIMKLALSFGIMTTFTSFITLGLTFKKILWYDFKISKHLSWLISSFLPLALFLLGLESFIIVISLTGGVMLGIDVVIIVLTYLKAKKRGSLEPAYSIKSSSRWAYLIIFFFVLGIIYEIFYFLH